MHLISIILPVYNEEKYIEDCLLSIKNQSYRNFECVIIDDGSTDSTSSLVKTITSNDHRFKYYKRKHHGLIKSINKGIDLALGTVICRMDGDDIMPIDRLQIQLSKLISKGKKSLITGEIKYFSDTSISAGCTKYEQWLNSLHNHEDFTRNAFIECPVASPSWMMFRSDVIKLGSFDNDIYPEDYNFILKCLNNGISFYSIKQCVLHWRDYSTRTSKISINYSRANFWQVRVRHLRKFIETHAVKYTDIVIFGVGSSGKDFCKALTKVGIKPKNFVDVHEDRIGKNILNCDVLSYLDYEHYKTSYILIAVRENSAKAAIKNFLQSKNKTELNDYLFCC